MQSNPEMENHDKNIDKKCIDRLDSLAVQNTFAKLTRLSNVMSIVLKNFFNSIKLIGSYNRTALRSSGFAFTKLCHAI